MNLDEHRGLSVGERLQRHAALDRPGDAVFAAFVETYLTGYPDFDVEPGDDAELYASLVRHFELGFRRSEGAAITEVWSPHTVDSATECSYVFGICDDRPFLVDTIRIALARFGVRIHRLIPPMMLVRRVRAEMVEVGAAHRLDEPVVSRPDSREEAWTQVQIDAVDDATASALTAAISRAVGQVARAVEDFEPMQDRMAALDQIDPLLGWLANDHFVFLEATSYAHRGDALEELVDRRLGDRCAEQREHLHGVVEPTTLDPPIRSDTTGAVVERSMEVSSVHRDARMTVVTVARPGPDGIVYERFFGLLAASAYRASVLSIPSVGERAQAVIETAGFDPASHVGREIRNVLERLPRDVVFELDADRLGHLVFGVVALQERQVVRVFEVPEPNGNVTTVLAYLPRDRYTADLGRQVAACIATRLDSPYRDLETFVGTSSLARITFTLTERIGVDATTIADADRDDLAAIAEQIDEITTPWAERVMAARRQRSATPDHAPPGSESSSEPPTASAIPIGDVIASAPEEYRSAVVPSVAIDDIERLAVLLAGPSSSSTALWRDASAADGQWRIRIYQRGEPSSLTELLPMLGHLGLNVLEEHPYDFAVAGTQLHLLDIAVELPPGLDMDPTRERNMLNTLELLICGEVEPDGFNRLVLVAGLAADQVAVLRAYAKYLHQTDFTFSQAYIEDALARRPALTQLLIELFEQRFDPRLADEGRGDRVRRAQKRVVAALEAVDSLDDDRIIGVFRLLILATVRTSAFSDRTPTIAFKFNPTITPTVPDPRPAHEIFVTSPRVEGVHLRGGDIARGGIRWSDRIEDYRTEVLGLVKAQMVKNAVIVPVGAKGGFVVKSDLSGKSNDERQAEGRACYRDYISSLLDLTDNLVDDRVIHPADCVLYDDDDVYLVVAADKGTASFSDLANSVASDYDYWLGDAFASGGSVGYDHKAMGITARGAWESAKRHGRSLGLDIERDEITVVGIGDMSGDVFGNGMLLSNSIKLVAAFDHRHVFVDPDPDPAIGYEQRRRLFDQPGSNWADYDAACLSPGGGVFDRRVKSIPISPPMRQALGIDADVTMMSPAELISAILAAPVTMLWNGGIGTYVKAETETHSQVGDRTNDAVRVNATQLRAQMVVEGGNLGLTQLARVEYALHGGLVYTDAIDNSAGVDTSDHEVNIKILLDAAVADGRLDRCGRQDLLGSMTAEVANLVLDNNRAQTLALAIARDQALPMVNVHARYLDALQTDGLIDRRIESLPSDKQIAERQLAGRGLCAPELAVLIAYTKNLNIVEIVGSDVVDLPALEGDVEEYFPAAVREPHRDLIATHRLRRQIAATQLVNQMTNLSGISYVRRAGEDTGASVRDIARAWLLAREVLGFHRWWDEVLAADGMRPGDQVKLLLLCRQAAERASLWFLRNRRPPVDIDVAVEQFRAPIASLLAGMRSCLRGPMAGATDELEHRFVAEGAPEPLARNAALWPLAHTAFDVVEVAHQHRVDPLDAASVYWQVLDVLNLEWLWTAIGSLPRSDRWQAQARATLRDDLLAVLAALACSVLEHADDSVAAWKRSNRASLDRTNALLTQIGRADGFTLTNLTVALRQLRNLAATSQRS